MMDKISKLSFTLALRKTVRFFFFTHFLRATVVVTLAPGMLAADDSIKLGVKQNIHVEMFRNPSDHIRRMVYFCLLPCIFFDLFHSSGSGFRRWLFFITFGLFAILDYHLSFDDPNVVEEISSSYHVLRTFRRLSLALINVFVWINASRVIYSVPYNGIGRNFHIIIRTLNDWTVRAYFVLIILMSGTFAVFYHIQFAERKPDGDHTFGASFLVAFRYFMSSEQTTDFLKSPDQFDIFPTSFIFFFIISCFSLLFNNLATSLMTGVRESRDKQWTQHHTDSQLSALAAIVERCRRGGNSSHYWRRFMEIASSRTRKMSLFQTSKDQYYVLSWTCSQGASTSSTPKFCHT
jgi:hypothetical protein